jgi:hypothetical protein
MRARCGYSEYHGVLRVPTRVRCAERAEEYAIRFVRVALLVVAQVSADGLGEAGAKSEAPPRPAEPTKARAPRAAGSTTAAQRGGSGRPVPAPRRSAPLASAHDRTNLPVALRCSGGRAAAALRTTVAAESTLTLTRPQCEYPEYPPELYSTGMKPSPTMCRCQSYLSQRPMQAAACQAPCDDDSPPSKAGRHVADAV